jgi:hypothetical protein
MHGRYPDYDVLEQKDHWDEVTRGVIMDRVDNPPPVRFFTQAEVETLSAFCDAVTAQDREPKIPILNFVDEKMYEADEKGLDGYQYAEMPDDRETWRLVARGLDEEAKRRGGSPFHTSPEGLREGICAAFSSGELSDGVWDRIPRAWSVVMRSVLAAFYGHPWAWNEIGYGGPAYPRGFMRLQVGQKEPWEGEPAADVDPVPYVGASGGGTGGNDEVPADWEEYREGTRRAADIAEATQAKDSSAGNRLTNLKRLLKGAVGPKDNDSRYLLDVHKRGIPGVEKMRRYRDEDEVDMVIVGCGAGGGTLARGPRRRPLLGPG